MSQTTMQRVVGRLRMAIEVEQTPDGALLEVFVRERSETAFAELVRRHGPMVWGVCWRLLSSRQDAEDCYQATFLVLVRKARTVRPRSRIGAWLHGVAYHAALKARQAAARRRQKERAIDPLPEPVFRPDATADLRELLDRGLHELPDKYRIPIVLCELEGRTLKEVADQLGSPIGTVAGWLARGRALLVRRLAKHGLPAVAIAALIAENANAAPPAPPVLTTASSTAHALADATIRTLSVATLKSWLLAVAAVLALTWGAAWVYHAGAGNQNAVVPRVEVVPAPLPIRGHVERLDANPPTLVKAKDVGKKLITKEAQNAIDGGLAYLEKEQAEDGSWGTAQYKGSVGVTSLAGLAFLSGNHHPDQGKYGKTVAKAVRFVLSQEDKDTPGYFKGTGATSAHGPMYSQGFAVLFLADVHAVTSDKELKADVKAALERSVKLIVAAQNPDGGWRYTPRPLDADLTVSACQIAALRAARDAGFEVPKATFDKALAYVKRCQHPDDGGFRYQHNAGPSGFARTGAGLTALNRLGVKDGKPVENGMAYLQGEGQRKEAAQIHFFYGHYYAAKAMWYAGDKDWQKWYPTIRDELLASRKDDRWSQSAINDPHFGTSMALIILQMPNGHLPSMKR